MNRWLSSVEDQVLQGITQTSVPELWATKTTMMEKAEKRDFGMGDPAEVANPALGIV